MDLEKISAALRVSLICVTAAAAATAISHFSVLARTEAVLADHFRFSMKRPSSEAIILISVDEAVIRETGKFPYDRALLARTLNFLDSAGAQRIFIDGSLSSPEDSAGDQALEAALAALGPARIALPVSRIGTPSGQVQYTRPLQRFSRHTSPAASALLYDSDNRVRRISALPELGIKLSADWLLDPLAPLRAEPLTIDYSIDKKSLRRFSMLDVAAGRIEPSAFMGQRIIIGLEVATPQFIVHIPGFQQAGRIELMALAAETIAAPKTFMQLSAVQSGLIVLLAVLLAAPLLLPLSPAASLFVCVSAGIIWLAAVDLLQAYLGIALPVIAPALALLLLWQALKLRGSRLARLIDRLRTKLFGASKAALLATLEMMTEPAAIFDATGLFQGGNAAFHALGLAADDRRILKAVLHSAESQNQDATPAKMDVLTTAQNGNGLRTFESHIRWLNSSSGRLAVVALRDTTDATKRERELSDKAFTDSLTGLANRAAFNTRLLAAEASAENKPFGLLIIDLDGFKQVNDTLGHHAGDELLACVALRMSALLGSDDFCARMGGDEFGIIASHGDEATCVRLATQVLISLVKPFQIEGKDARIGASIGIALCPMHHKDAREVLKLADAAMYVSKRNKPAYAVHTADGVTAAKSIAA